MNKKRLRSIILFLTVFSFLGGALLLAVGGLLGTVMGSIVSLPASLRERKAAEVKA